MVLQCAACSDSKNCSHVKHVHSLTPGTRPSEPGDDYRKELADMLQRYLDPVTGKFKATSVSQVRMLKAVAQVECEGKRQRHDTHD